MNTNLLVVDRLVHQMSALVLERSEVLMITVENALDPRLFALMSLHCRSLEGDLGAQEQFASSRLKMKEDDFLSKLASSMSHIFTALTDIYTTENIVGQVMEEIFNAKKAYYQKETSDCSSRFYETSMVEAIQHIMLALCPTTIGSLLSYINVFCHSEDIIEKAVDLSCHIDRLTSSLKLKEEIKETLLSNVSQHLNHPLMDACLLQADPAKASLLKDILLKLPGISPLTLRSPKTNLTTHLQRMAGDPVKAGVNFCVSMKRLADKLLIFDSAPFTGPLLQWLLLSASTMTWSADDSSAAGVFALLGERLKSIDREGIPLVDEFLLRLPFNKAISKLSTQDSTMPAETELKTCSQRLPSNTREVGVRKKFEEKKDRVMRLMKMRQSSFLEESGGHSQQTTQPSESKDLVCSVSKEPLRDSQTYFMHAQCHMTNVALPHLVTRPHGDPDDH